MSWKKTVFSGILVAFCIVMLYGIVMTPETASASRPDLNLDSLRVYFLYEDHIGRPVLMSEYEDYDSDGSYFTDDNANDYPYFHASYDPFGSINEDFDSTGIVVGNNNDTKITWAVPFRFPGQYQDPELEGIFYYNWNRYYSPAIGRYNRADPMSNSSMNSVLLLQAQRENINNLYCYVSNSPLFYIDPQGLKECCDSGKEKDCRSGRWFGAIAGIEAGTVGPGSSVSCGFLICKGSFRTKLRVCIGCFEVGAHISAAVPAGVGASGQLLVCKNAKCIEDLRGKSTGLAGSGGFGIYGGGGNYDISKSTGASCWSFGGGVGTTFVRGAKRYCDMDVMKW